MSGRNTGSSKPWWSPGGLAWLAALLLFVAPAQSGAFLQAPGEGIVIAGAAATNAVRAYDALGRLVPVAPWRKFEASSYAEYGVTDWLTVIASPSLFVFRQTFPGQNRSATGVAEAGARVRAYEWDGNILSGQVIARAPLAGQSARPFVDTTRFVQVDVRAAWGQGFEVWGLRAFSDVQIGFRSNGNFGHEGRLDATVGVHVLTELLVIFQSFTAVAPGRIGRSLYLSQKVQVSGLYWFLPNVGVQVGGLLGLRGVNTGAERGVFSALWVKF